MRNRRKPNTYCVRNNGKGIIAVMSTPRSVEARNGNHTKIKTPARLPDKTKEM
jgi:hypothetical protein